MPRDGRGWAEYRSRGAGPGEAEERDLDKLFPECCKVARSRYTRFIRHHQYIDSVASTKHTSVGSEGRSTQGLRCTFGLSCEISVSTAGYSAGRYENRASSIKNYFKNATRNANNVSL